jgi:GNAT superfamily N-acetyltransferase
LNDTVAPEVTVDEVTVKRVSAEVVYPLRHAVLRTGKPWADVIYSADTDPLSAHFAAISPDGSTVLAVGSVLPEAPEWSEAPDWSEDPSWQETSEWQGDSSDANGRAWRVRGMAVRPDSRGSGLGTEILGRLLAHVASNGGGMVWCTARIAAISLYERAGLVARGDTEVLPGIGAHRVMSGFVAPDQPI